MKKKIVVALAIVAILVISLGCVFVSAATSGTCGTDITWSLESGTLTLSGSGEMKNYSGYSSVPWYSNRSSIKTVVVEEGITSISDYSFHSETALTSVSLPSTLESIGKRAFYNCNALTEIVIPGGVHTMGYEMFYQCYKLKSVKLPENITIIPEDTFFRCKALEEIVIPDTVTVIGADAFNSCEKLKSVTLSKEVATLNASAFNGCAALEEIVLHDKLTVIGDCVFLSCTSLKSITIPYTVIKYGSLAFTSVPKTAVVYGYTGSVAEDIAKEYSFVFEGTPLPDAKLIEGSLTESINWYVNTKRQLVLEGEGEMPDLETNAIPWEDYEDFVTEIVLDDKITRIGKNNFRDMEKLEKITFGEGILSVGKYAFEGCSQVGEIVFNNSITTIEANAFSGLKKVKTLTLPNSLTAVGNSAFYNFDALESLTLPTGNVTWGSGVFESCDILASVSLPEAMTKIPASMFANCSKLTDVTFNGPVTEIGASAFKYSLSSVDFVLPETVEKIGANAFERSGITSIYLPEGLTEIGASAFRACTKLTNITIPTTVAVIPDYAFSGSEGLNDIRLHDSITSIGSYAFEDCLKFVENYEIPKSVTKLSNNAFRNCDAQSFKLHEGLLEIGSYAFYHCPNLNEITIPSSVTKIPDYAFYECGGLKKVNMSSVTEIGSYAFAYSGLEEFHIPETVTKIGSSLFQRCSLLTKVTVPGSVNTIPSSIFANCANLKTITLEEGITTISTSAFNSCTAVTEIVLPESVTSIGQSAFNGCSSLKKVEITEGVGFLPRSVFVNCNSLEEVTIPDTVLFMESGIFFNVPETVVIKGYNDTVAEEYALANNYTFVSLGEKSEKVSASGSFDNISWSLTNFGNLTLSGSGNIPELAPPPWNKYYDYVKTITIKEGISAVDDIKVDRLDNLEKVTYHYSVGYIYSNNVNYMPDGAVVEGYSESCAQYIADKYSCEFVSLGKSPLTLMRSGQIKDTDIKWEMYSDGTLNLTGTGKTGDFSDDTTLPWWYYFNYIKTIKVGEGITRLGKIYLDEYPKLENLEVHHSVIYIYNSLKLFVNDNITITGYTHSIAEFLANTQGHNFVSLGEMPECVIVSGSVGDETTYSIDSRGTLTISGRGETDKYTGSSSSGTVPWYYYRNYVKKLICEEGVTLLDYWNGNEHENIKEIELHYSLLLGRDFENFGEGVTITGYEKSFAEGLASETGAKFVSLGVMPEDDVIVGTLENVTWSLNGYGKLTLSGEGNVVHYYTGNEYPWYPYQTIIKELYVNEGITQIPAYVLGYYDDYAVTKVTMPVSVTSFSTNGIETGAVFYCYKYSFTHDKVEPLTRYNLEFIGIAPKVVVEEGTFGDLITWRYYNHRILELEGEGAMPDEKVPWDQYKKSIEKVEISENITTIASNAFTNAPITEFEFSDKLTKIGYSAFGSTLLTEAIIPESVTSVGNQAFYACGLLEEITIPENLIVANFNMVKDCNSLKKIHGYTNSFAERLADETQVEFVSMGEAERYFERADITENVWVEADNLGYLTFKGKGEIPAQNVTYPTEDTPWGKFISDNLHTIVVEGTITKIGDEAFDGMETIENVIIHEGVKKIGKYSFSHMNITEIYFPDSIKEMDEYTFWGCYNLETVRFGKELDVIPTGCFHYCSNLKYVEIPQYIEEISAYSFYQTGNVEYIHYLGSEWRWENYVTGRENLPEGAVVLFESSIPEESKIEVKSVVKNTKAIKVTITQQLLGSEGAYLAAYDSDGAMTELVRIVPGTTEYSLDRKSAVIKVFLWNSTKGLVPISETYTKIMSN